MEMEKGMEEMEKQEEEHHIDKKQKTENQQDEVVKVRRPRKLSRNKKMFPGRGIPWDLFYGGQQLNRICRIFSPLVYLSKSGLKSIVILDFDDFLLCLRWDILMHPPACYRSPTYVTMYGYEAAEILLQGDGKKLRESIASTKW